LFVALAYMLLRSEGTGVYALAGQPAPLLRRSSGKVSELPAPRNRLPVGALKEAHWDVMPFAAQPDDLLLLYSDGLTDARTPDGEPFGDERLARILAESTGDPRGVVDEVMRAVDAFSAGSEPYDDITLVAAQWTGVPR
jgi:sigma-B regulation protein RsbU (phosphoserine phosphatase)